MLLKALVGKGDQGMYASWTEAKDQIHRREAEMQRIYPDIWPQRGGPLPYRLTSEQITMLDRRMGRLLWPHYVERLYYKGYSFWKRPSRMWKMRRKLRLLYYILPTQIRDQVPLVRHALNTFVWAMRRLEGGERYFCVLYRNKYFINTHIHTTCTGQVHSWNTCIKMGISPGSFCVNKDEAQACHMGIIRGLVLFEGVLPLSHLNPGMHHFVHYAQYTLTHGSLRAFWMMGFERYNKYLKSLVRNNQHPEVGPMCVLCN